MYVNFFISVVHIRCFILTPRCDSSPQYIVSCGTW